MEFFFLRETEFHLFCLFLVSLKIHKTNHLLKLCLLCFKSSKMSQSLENVMLSLFFTSSKQKSNLQNCFKDKKIMIQFGFLLKPKPKNIAIPKWVAIKRLFFLFITQKSLRFSSENLLWIFSVNRANENKLLQETTMMQTPLSPLTKENHSQNIKLPSQKRRRAY